MVGLWQDVRFAARVLVRNPGIAAVAALTLALGIGATTAIFSVVEAVLLRPLPFHEPDRLVMLWERNIKRDRPRNVVGPANYLPWKERNQSFESMAAFSPWTLNIAGQGEPERVPVGAADADFFSVFGVNAALGRMFLPEDGKPDAPAVVVLSYGLWQQRYGFDPEVIGKTLSLNGQPATIVGVAPAFFKVPPTAELWVPIQFGEQHRRFRGRYLAVVARLKPGVTVGQALAEMEGIHGVLEKEDPDFNAGWTANVVPMREQLVGDVRSALLVLFGAVGLVLLIGCANIANLLLARAASREREMAIRAALGARRLRLVRQLLTESLLLALVGGAAGLAVADLTLEGLLAIVPTEIPRFVEIGLHPGVLGFALGLSLLTGILFGLAPAVTASRTELNESLKEGARGSGSPGGRRLRSALVVSEVALALVLLIGAGLLLRSFDRLQSVDPGFNPERVLTLQLSLSGTKYSNDQQRTLFFEQALERIGGLPQVESAAAVSWLPMGGPGSATSFYVLDRPRPAAGEDPVADVRVITPGFFRTLEIPLQHGRDFTRQDTAEAPKVVVINEAMARHFWPGENPVGKRLSMSWDADIEAEIVGVVGDVHLVQLDTAPRHTIYWTQPQLPYSFMTFMIRTAGDPLALATPAREQIRAIDPEQPVAEIRTMDQALANSLKRPRFTVLLLGAFAGLALLLAAIGIYGIISYSVNQRTHEIGIRMALGARPADIFRMVVGEGIRLTLAGAALGVVGALAATRVLASLLFNVTPTDTVTFVSVPLLLALVALAASYIPARRATRVAPMTALRYE